MALRLSEGLGFTARLQFGRSISVGMPERENYDSSWADVVVDVIPNAVELKAAEIGIPL